MEDEILSPSFPLRHGDVVRAEPAAPEAARPGGSFADRVADRVARARWEGSLWVFDSEASCLVRVPYSVLSLAAWENERVETLILRCSGVNPWCLALAAADCVDIALSLPPRLESDVVNAVRRWAEGSAPPPVASSDPREADEWSGTRDDLLALALWHLARSCREAWPGAYAAVHAASSACAEVATADVAEVHASMASAVRRRIPFSVVACSALRLRDPLPGLWLTEVSP